MAFFDRRNELKELKGILNSDKFELLVIYGRRRVGKTALVLEATRNRKRVYFLATTEKNLERFQAACAEFDSSAANLKPDYEVLFGFLKERHSDAVVIIDEFQNLIREDKNAISVFQAIVDAQLKDSKMKLILLGSSVSLMTSKVLSYRSPLYGRRTASFKLKPVSFFDLREFFPKASAEELVEIYGFADGIPNYLVKIEGGFWNWLDAEAKRETSFLRDEVDFLMRYEFDNPGTYKLILEAIANGKTVVNEIRDFMHVSRTDLSPYLKNLIELDMVKREVPINENQKSRLGRYYLNDNFLRFWFRFIYPNLSSIGAGGFEARRIGSEYSSYLGTVFERVAQQFLVRKRFFPFTKIGKWWQKGEEIDLVAVNEPVREFLFAECKWRERVDAEKIAEDLLEKSRGFVWSREKRNKEELAIFAKSFSRKISELEGRRVHCFDLTDIGKLLSENRKEE